MNEIKNDNKIAEKIENNNNQNYNHIEYSNNLNSKEKAESTLSNTVASSVYNQDNDIIKDTEIKTHFSSSNDFKKFKESLEETKNCLKANEFTINNSNNSNNKHYDVNDIKISKFNSQTSKNSNYLQQEKILCKLDDIQDQNWNQFEDNQKLYKVKSSYNENKYNSEIKLEKVPEQVKNAAEQIERELKMTNSKNTHLNEERGKILNNESESEEAKYSSVIRNGNKTSNKTKNNNKKNSNENKRSKLKLVCYLLFAFVLGLSIFVGYRLHKISSQRNFEEQEDEDDGFIFESSSLEIPIENEYDE